MKYPLRYHDDEISTQISRWWMPQRRWLSTRLSGRLTRSTITRWSEFLSWNHIVSIEANKKDRKGKIRKRLLFSTSKNSIRSVLISFPWSRYSCQLSCWNNIYHNDYYYNHFKYLSKNPFRGPDIVASWLFDRSGSILDLPIQTWRAKWQVAGFYLFTHFYRTWVRF